MNCQSLTLSIHAGQVWWGKQINVISFVIFTQVEDVTRFFAEMFHVSGLGRFIDSFGSSSEFGQLMSFQASQPTNILDF